MSTQDFIKIEAEAIRTISKRSSQAVWEVVECGALEHMRLYAESQNYNVTVEDLVYILWADLCYHKNVTGQSVYY